MAVKSWVLTDVDRDVYVDKIALGPNEAGGKGRGYSVTKRTLRGGLSDGVDVVEVNNGRLQFVIIPTRGMGIWKAALGDLKLGWQSPIKGPVHPCFVRLDDASGIGWLDGFDEMLCRCGLESNGGPDFNEKGILRYGLHGKIANKPAHKVEVAIDGDEGVIRVTGVVDETRVFCNKLRMTTEIVTRLGDPTLTITDTITNISAQPADLELLYHINFGIPLLNPGSKIVLPAKKVSPRDPVAVENLPQWNIYGPETPGSSEVVLFFDLLTDADGQTQTLLRNAAGNQGVSLRFNKKQFPFFTLWKNRQAAIDGYVTGLEPGINFPNPKSFEKQKGRVAVVPPGESRTFQIAITAHPDADSVTAAERAVAQLQGSTAPEICPQPDPNWAM